MTLVCAAASLAAFACEGPTVEPLVPNLLLPSEFILGQVVVDSRANLTFSIENTGRVVGNVDLSSPPAPFSFSLQSFEVPAGGVVDVTLTAQPVEVGAVEVTHWIVVDDNERPVKMTFTAIPSPACDDQNPCTVDQFDLEVIACTHTQREGECSDDNACTSDDRCLVGVCVGDRVQCDDGVECTVDACNPSTGCIASANDDRCDDGDACTDNHCDEITGCGFERSEEGKSCGEGVVCETALACFSGVCTAVTIPNGAPCDDGELCSSAAVCEAGACTGGDVGGISHTVIQTRTFLTPSAIEDDKHQAALMNGTLWVNESYQGLRVARVDPGGYDVIATYPPSVSAVVATVDQTVLELSDDDQVGYGLNFYDASGDEPTLLGRRPIPPARAGTLTANGAGDIGYCSLDDDPNAMLWRVVRNPRVASSVLETKSDFVPCGFSRGLVGIGNRLIFYRPGQGIFAYNFEGEEFGVQIEQPPTSENFAESFRVGNFAAYVVEPFNGGTFLRLVHATTLLTSLVGIPPVRQVLGAFGRRVYVVTTTGHLSSFEVTSTGEVGNLQSNAVLLPAGGPSVFLLAASDNLVVVHARGADGFQGLWSFSLDGNGEVEAFLRDGFATSVEAFEVGADQTLTVFGREAVTRGDIASMAGTFAAPLSRRSPPLSVPSIVFDEGAPVGSYAPQRGANVGYCSQCNQQPSVVLSAGGVAALDFVAGAGGMPRPLDVAGLGEEELGRTLIGASAFGGHMVAWDAIDRRLSWFDLAPASATGFPYRAASLVILLPDIEARRVATHIHRGGRVTLIVGDEALLVDFSVTPPGIMARTTVDETEARSFTSAFADDESWLVLLSGGSPSPLGALPAEPVLVTVDLNGTPGNRVVTSLAPTTVSENLAYRVRILGVADDYIYLGSVSVELDRHQPEVQLLRRDFAGAPPSISIPSEAVGMAVLDDGTRVIGRVDGFSFLLPQCSN